ncbi:MAG: GNAT family N-acetyltransferase [Promethearchaeota archaeon]
MFEGKLIELRPFELEDVDEILKHINSYLIRQYTRTGPFLFSRHAEENFIKTIWDKADKGTDFEYAIIYKETGELIGGTGFFNIKYFNRSAEFGIGIFDSKNFNKGFGTETIKIMLEIGFNTMNLHSISLKVFEHNKRARRVYSKCGFKEVGKLREHLFSEGTYQNMILMDLLEIEYREVKRKSIK